MMDLCFYAEVTTFDLDVCKIGSQLASLGSHVLNKNHLFHPSVKEGLSNVSLTTQETTSIVSKLAEVTIVEKLKKLPKVNALCFETKATICLKVNKHENS